MTKLLWWISTFFWLLMFIIGFLFIHNSLLHIFLLIGAVIIIAFQASIWKLTK